MDEIRYANSCRLHGIHPRRQPDRPIPVLIAMALLADHTLAAIRVPNRSSSILGTNWARHSASSTSAETRFAAMKSGRDKAPRQIAPR
jgi:hypothetical protein